MHSVDVQGEQVPALGFGTWQIEGDDAIEGVRNALELGYRHIDTAQIYGNEAEVGAGIRASDVPRDEIFLTTKVWRSKAAPEAVRSSTEESLRKLGVDHVDLLLLHWPTKDVPLAETLGALTELVEAGKTRFIGVSNFTPDLVEEAVGHATIFANQVEYHPFLDQSALVDLARKHDHLLTAYSPIAQGKVGDDAEIRAIGEAHGKSPVQVTLRWLLQQDNVAAIPKAASAGHRESNLDVFDFELDADQMERIADLADVAARLVDPDWAAWNW
jgi:diketogulonate reductase-like aldo/keto reductase